MDPENVGWRECDRERCTVAINAALYVVCKFRAHVFSVSYYVAGASLIRVRVRPWYQVCAARTPLPSAAPSARSAAPDRTERIGRSCRRARARSRHQINNVYIWTIWHILWVARASARFCLSSHARCSRAYLNAYISWRRALAKRVCMKTLSFQTDGHLNSLLYRPQHSENQRCCGWHFEGRNECFEEISRNPFIF